MVAAIPLRLGDLDAQSFSVARSGLRWLLPDGHNCASGDIVASCRIGVRPAAGTRPAQVPLADERYDLHVGFVLGRAGRLRHQAGVSAGGELDLQHFNRPWDAETVIGVLEPLDDHAEVHDGPSLRLIFLAGRRMTDLAEDRKGLLTGWHDRTRAWHGEGQGHSTLLSLGICEQNGVVRGERQAFLELLQDSAGPLHAVYIADEGQVPSSPVLLSQLARTPGDVKAITIDLAESLSRGAVTPGPEDYFFLATSLQALGRCPITDHYDILTRHGLSALKPAQTILLSLHAESAVVFRHRKLGYIANWHRFRVQAGGQATREWLRANFEPIRRTPADIERDYRQLAAKVRACTGARLLVMNNVSSSAHEDITNYASFEGPLHETLASIRAKELNLMLDDLAADGVLTVIDADAIAAELGAGAHIPDGVHQSAQMQQELRSEILHQLGLDHPIAAADSFEPMAAGELSDAQPVA